MTLTEQQFDKSAAECRSIYEKKLKDYGAAWRIMRPASLTDQIFIKANRIRSLEIKGTSMVNEGIRPELIGIINYCIIALIQLELGYAETDDLPVERALEMYDRYLCKGTHPNSTYADQVRHFRLLAEALEKVLHAVRRFLGRIANSVKRTLCRITHNTFCTRVDST